MRQGASRGEGMRCIRANPRMYIMILPVIAYYLVFSYAPMYGIVMAFQEYSFAKGVFGSPFVGLENFALAFGDVFFRQALMNTLIISAWKIALNLVCPLALALALNEVRRTGYKRLVQTVSYLPYFISWVVIGGMLNTLLSKETGAVNHLMSMLGLERTEFMIDNACFRPIVVLSAIWKDTGWNAVLYLAAIAAINPELYQAARIDGAGRFQLMRHITLPSISSTVAVVFILAIGNLLNAGFDQIINLYSPPVFETGDILDTYLLRTLQGSSGFGKLAAAGLIKSGINFLTLLGANRLVHALGSEGFY